MDSRAEVTEPAAGSEYTGSARSSKARVGGSSGGTAAFWAVEGRSERLENPQSCFGW